MPSKLNTVLLFVILCFTSVIQAAINPVKWTQSTLLSTLTVDYQNYHTILEKERKNYTSSAWSAMDSFLGNYVINLTNNQLSLHPKLINPGVVVDSGNISNINYWRITQIINIPELMVTLKFSVVVVQPKNSSLIIQSVNVNKV